MKSSIVSIPRTTIILSLVILCFSGSFSAIHYLPPVQAQTQETTSQPSIEEVNAQMAQISASNNRQDIATLAYIWGNPLVVMGQNANWFTNPNTPPGNGVGPWNTMVPSRHLLNASFRIPGLAPNADTLYDNAWLDLEKEPLVLKVPPIPDRYYTIQFNDAYGSTSAYVGSRTTGSDGGTYLITGPQWSGQIPDGMTMLKSPTNLAWIQGRILVKGPDDVMNVRAIQDEITLQPLQVFQGNATSTSASQMPPTTANPLQPDPSSIPKSGIKAYDEISQRMVGNPPNPSDPQLISKFATIGIGPGKVPSKEANNTIKTALQTGITEGQKLMKSKWANVGQIVNGWSVNMNLGDYGTDYLLRAAATFFACCANIAQEALYVTAHTDVDGKSLSGANNYTIHFNPGSTPPVKGFWSITLYDNLSLFIDNPINRYNIGDNTAGLKNSTDGSLDIYIQHENPGKDKESNWLPSPAGSFYLILRMYVPGEEILNATWPYPSVQREN